jgi:S-DNA-T family DNA segregation ATPase FtsK/SpoIIIE
MHGCRNAHSFNEKNTEEVLPNILVLCDEIADLMMVDGEFYDNAFFKIVEKGRAVGMHLIISTSRPSRDIITDTMIQSIQYRIGFAAASEVDSQRIIGQSGAEQLLGKGDMLLRETESSSLLRLQAPYLSDDDVASVTDFLRSQSAVKYIDVDAKVKSYSDVDDGDLYEDAKSYVIEQQKAGTAILQMKFQIGYGRAARIIEKLEEDEIIGPADGASPRKVYVNSPE